ncbi:MAG TPA: MFS transporter [Candidatus Udaeobacter sp.]|nr:MFS transporter [Candidatus Udaeobacter sp.]
MKEIFRPLRELDQQQRNAVIASFLGWSLDAFDFFILVFVIKDIAHDFGSAVKDVAFAITLTLAMRPVGALIFGLMADRFGRRPTLMVDILCYSLMELLTAFAPSLGVLLVFRALYGIAMGGEWGVGASLTMESIPAKARGIVSGILQEGYAAGYLLAAVVYGLFYAFIGWRGMFIVGVLPGLLVLYIRLGVKESPTWQRTERPKMNILETLRGRWRLLIYTVLMMTAFNFFSHGTQDLYPTFLEVQHKLSPRAVGIIAVIYNIGAILGGICFGALSERIGRRRAIVFAALLAIPIAPIWAFSASAGMLALGAFLIQISVQGAWGVVPTHLNELSPEEVRGTFPGFTYQLGNLLAAANAPLQAWIAERNGGDYGLALAIVAVVAAIAVAVLAGFGMERKGVTFGLAPGE